MGKKAEVASPLHEKLSRKDIDWGAPVEPWARRLRVPYSRIYDMMPTMGFSGITNLDEALQVIVRLQQRASPFAALAELLGRSVTLGDLADLEDSIKE